MRISILTLFFFLLIFDTASAQDSLPARKKFSPFIYNENESEAVFDVGISAGFVSDGGLISVRPQFDYYHVLIGYGFDGIFHVSNDYIFVQSGHFGYRYRTTDYMLALMSGFSRSRYKCYGCGDDYETTNSVPLELQADWIITNAFGIGIIAWHQFGKMNDLSGISVGIKFGALRTTY